MRSCRTAGPHTDAWPSAQHHRRAAYPLHMCTCLHDTIAFMTPGQHLLALVTSMTQFGQAGYWHVSRHSMAWRSKMLQEACPQHRQTHTQTDTLTCRTQIQSSTCKRHNAAQHSTKHSMAHHAITKHSHSPAWHTTARHTNTSRTID